MQGLVWDEPELANKHGFDVGNINNFEKCKLETVINLMSDTKNQGTLHLPAT